MRVRSPRDASDAQRASGEAERPLLADSVSCESPSQPPAWPVLSGLWHPDFESSFGTRQEWEAADYALGRREALTQCSRYASRGLVGRLGEDSANLIEAIANLIATGLPTRFKLALDAVRASEAGRARVATLLWHHRSGVATLNPLARTHPERNTCRSAERSSRRLSQASLCTPRRARPRHHLGERLDRDRSVSPTRHPTTRRGPARQRPRRLRSRPQRQGSPPELWPGQCGLVVIEVAIGAASANHVGRTPEGRSGPAPSLRSMASTCWC